MLGRQHALAGATAWLAVSPLVDVAAGLNGPQIALGAALATGAGMVPDLDQPGSTISRTYGPVTNIASHVVALIAFGHRMGTHCLLGLAVIIALTTGLAAAGGLGLAVLVWVLLGVAVRALGMSDMDGPGRVRGPRWLRYLIGSVTNGLTMAVVTWVLYRTHLDVALVVPWAVAVGVASHIGTDCLTDSGCPLAWPLSRRRYGWRLFTTGGKGKTAQERARSSRRLTAGLTALLVLVAVVRVA